MRAVVSCFPALFLLLPCSTAWGQDSLALEAGNRVRCCSGSYGSGRCHHGRITGTMISWDADGSLMLQADAGSLTVPRDSLTRLEVSRGFKRRWVNGAVVGGIIGLAAGTSAAVIEGWPFETVQDCADRLPDEQLACNLAFVGWRVALGAAVGAALGAVAGSAFKTERWQEVPLDRLRVQPVVMADGRFGVAASLRF